MRSVFIIAEAGVNHNGRLDLAMKLVDAAKEAGADAIKFQTFKAERLVTREAPKAKYQAENVGADVSQFEMLHKLELPMANHHKILSYCRERGILFLSTAFDEEGADLLDGMGMTIFKIPSGEITNKGLIQHIAKKNKPIILSTGMSYLGEVEKAVLWIQEIWNGLSSINNLSLLHCVSNYPARVEDSNLLAVLTLSQAFHLPTGYSDHSLGIEVPIAAAALGSTIIEKHFTLDRGMEGPDHKASLEPGELKEMIQAIRNVEKALGNGLKKPVVSEENTRLVARKSLIAARQIEIGERIGASDIQIKRPGTGIQPEFKEQIAGMTAKRRIYADSVIHWEDLTNA